MSGPSKIGVNEWRAAPPLPPGFFASAHSKSVLALKARKLLILHP